MSNPEFADDISNFALASGVAVPMPTFCARAISPTPKKKRNKLIFFIIKVQAKGLLNLVVSEDFS
jgi:hypothetical protein